MYKRELQSSRSGAGRNAASMPTPACGHRGPPNLPPSQTATATRQGRQLCSPPHDWPAAPHRAAPELPKVLPQAGVGAAAAGLHVPAEALHIRGAGAAPSGRCAVVGGLSGAGRGSCGGEVSGMPTRQVLGLWQRQRRMEHAVCGAAPHQPFPAPPPCSSLTWALAWRSTSVRQSSLCTWSSLSCSTGWVD